MLERSHEYERMARVEQEHWWYVALHHLVLRALRRRFAHVDPAIIDAGCGTGGLMLFLRDRGYSDLQGFDLSEDAVRYCRARRLNAVQDNLLNIASRYPAGSADAIVSNDTIYFLDQAERRRFVRECHRVLRVDGILIFNVPTLAAFAGIHDLSVGIKQRLSKACVRDLLPPDRFDLLIELYWPFLLSPLVFLVRLAQRARMRRAHAIEVRSDIDLPNRVVNTMLGGLTRLENGWLPVKPWGSSLFVVAQRIGQQH